ncbi:hypothetical protein M2152_002314 [Microbacteriaceae bacterium SG_E_30_P1]|uniref:Uncharacterized protein n=1 Tax=Antiquaquibacter oligotrophicus TaxID=2880260 RepID=A0ABT6KSG5_9MICO|nr:hypothetical protein [Antiquaquibacter oligotrophicus]MDH6182132.1 hypothetical protein [Antiquaquibacter oligotrophicus]UDF12205.1 hypothetical protein LH407_08500 [Antiquaquibacter oligotrophicus]
MTLTTPPALDPSGGLNRSGEIDWSLIESVANIVFVGKENDVPVAIIQLNQQRLYALTTVTGIAVGTFTSVEDAQLAFEELRAEH